jgi:NAD-dependent dihydropyrimidine dehydrogenase PreA subunit
MRESDLTLLADFVTAFDVWDEVLPYLDMIVDEAEMSLIVALQGEALTAGQVAARLQITPGAATELLERAYSRCIVDRAPAADPATYSPASLYARLDHFAKFENWDDLPAGARERIDRRFLDEFIARHRPAVECKLAGRPAPGDRPPPNDAVLLLSEINAMLDAATDIVVQPCDCRRLGQHCERPVETCLALDGVAREVLARGHGTPLTREQAKKLVRQADRKGLMHTADSDWQTRGLTAICNCCACDCYPFRAALELGSKGVWPRSRYVAVYHREKCHFCGTCVRRCHFGAFYHDGTRVPGTGHPEGSANVVLDPSLCWGCGLCANTCPSGAIVMEPLS